MNRQDIERLDIDNPLIMNTGIDIVDIRRVEKLIGRYGGKFLNKVYTRKEQLYCEDATNKFEKYAGRFAAKEAIRKALQPFTDARYLPFTDIEILPDDKGLPLAAIQTDITFRSSFNQISISISHEKDYAVASAIIG